MPQLYWFPLWSADKLHAFRGKYGAVALCGAKRERNLPDDTAWFKARMAEGPKRCGRCTTLIAQDQSRKAKARKEA
jgi:hypothetical protein